MSFDLNQMQQANEPFARVVVAGSQGSVPREVGTSMLVFQDDVQGTIGGGALEFEAIRKARNALATGQDLLERLPLGPGLGQCCGGAVTLVTEVFDATCPKDMAEVYARPLPGGDPAMPMSVRRVLTRARNASEMPAPGILDGWLIEPVLRPKRDLWVWGAGHVGRAIVGVVSPLPDFRVFWADVDETRFPEDVPAGVETLVAANPADLVSLASRNAEHLVLTYSHALDLELCHRVLSQPFQSLGVIGSATKRARFRKRLAALGHAPNQIDRMVCPIGDPSLGKHPQVIALSVAETLVRGRDLGERHMEQRA